MCGWGDSAFMLEMLRELDRGAGMLPKARSLLACSSLAWTFCHGASGKHPGMLCYAALDSCCHSAMAHQTSQGILQHSSMLLPGCSHSCSHCALFSLMRVVRRIHARARRARRWSC